MKIYFTKANNDALGGYRDCIYAYYSPNPSTDTLLPVDEIDATLFDDHLAYISIEEMKPILDAAPPELKKTGDIPYIKMRIDSPVTDGFEVQIIKLSAKYYLCVPVTMLADYEFFWDWDTCKRLGVGMGIFVFIKDVCTIDEFQARCEIYELSKQMRAIIESKANNPSKLVAAQPATVWEYTKSILDMSHKILDRTAKLREIPKRHGSLVIKVAEQSRN
jgi:hypothetical protein